MLALFVRKDRMGYGYDLIPTGADPIRHHARNLYPSPNEAFPGEHASRAWDLLDVPTDLSPLKDL